MKSSDKKPDQEPQRSRSQPAADDLLKEFTRVLDLEADSILQASRRLLSTPTADRSPITEALKIFSEALESGGRIIVTGLGKSGKVAQKISATLSSTGSASLFLHPTEALHGDLGTVTPRDVVLALSHTGNTEEVLKLATALHSLGVRLVGLGGNPQSQLARLCQVWLDGSVEAEACPHNLAPTASTTLALALGDALAVTLMKLRGFNPSDFARNHPAGALGRRLHLRVRDVLHPRSSLPMVEPDCSIEKVLDASSRQNLGAVLVADSSFQLLGIITDGDIRRALQHKERFFSLTAEQIMTHNPVTISPDALAYEALEKMENRPSQIKELPVVDSNNRIEGLVRIHDLVKFF